LALASLAGLIPRACRSFLARRPELPTSAAPAKLTQKPQRQAMHHPALATGDVPPDIAPHLQDPGAMLLMIDNYDSFTFNLVQYFGELGQDVRVFRNDEITVQGMADLRPDRVVLSPGPCSPAEAGVCIEAIRHFAGKLPLLGVCLGHQAMGAALGGQVVRAQVQMHGKASTITTDQKGVFHGLPEQFSVIRYHSLAIDRASLPADLLVTATAEDGEIMGVRHRGLPMEGVQFHPESILSEHGHAMLKNFIDRVH
jgi:anthranilate synthase component II